MIVIFVAALGYLCGVAIASILARFTLSYREVEWLPQHVLGAIFWPLAILFYVCQFIFYSPGLLRRIDDRISFLLKRKIHQDEYGILYEFPHPLYNVVLKVKVKDSIGTYWLSVPPRDSRDIENSTAKEAVAWTYGMKEKEYNPVRV